MPGSDHSRIVLEAVAKRSSIAELYKMIIDKNKSIPLLQEQIKFCELAIDVYDEELRTRK